MSKRSRTNNSNDLIENDENKNARTSIINDQVRRPAGIDITANHQSLNNNNNNNNNYENVVESTSTLPSTSSCVSSQVLAALLSQQHNLTWDDFLNTIWQQQTYYFSSSPVDSATSFTNNKANGVWNDIAMQTDPWKEMIHQSRYIVLQLMEAYEYINNNNNDNNRTNHTCTMMIEKPIIFHNQQVRTWDDIIETYNGSLFGVYLDGCSIVWNHADLINPYIAHLCQDLTYHCQDRHVDNTATTTSDDNDNGDDINNTNIGFPHVYANCYLTPPNSQTAPIHADDRDVFIFQLIGKKEWKIYSKIPIPYPYPQEQVGKNPDLPVPKDVIHSPYAFHKCLQPGDILYIPRGMVHEAKSVKDEFSFHITIAIATHDWTIAGNMSRLIETKLLQTIQLRKSILPYPITNSSLSLQQEINRVFDNLKQEITANILQQDLCQRIHEHNYCAYTPRMALIHQARMDSIKLVENVTTIKSSESLNNNHVMTIGGENDDNTPLAQIVGPIAAAQKVYWTTRIRPATAKEREYATMIATNTTATASPPGLHVREDIADSILEIIAKVKASTIDSSITTTQTSQLTNETTKQIPTNYQVLELRHLLDVPNSLVCDMTLLCLVKQAVKMGAFAISSS